MATITREQISPWKTLSRGNFVTEAYPEATSQSILSGAMIRQIVDLTSGSMRKAGGTGPRASLAAGIRILGVAQVPFTNRTAVSEVSATMRTGTIATRDTVFKMHVSNGFGNQSLTRAQVGTAYGLVNLSNAGGSGIWCVNIGQTTLTNTYVRVVGLIDAVGDINGAVGVVFRNSLVFGS